MLFLILFSRGKKRLLKPEDLPVLDRRLPVARRYSNGLVKSVARLNAFTKLSVFMLISAFSALFSKTNLTDCNQLSSLSYGLKVRDLNLKQEKKKAQIRTSHQLHVLQKSSEISRMDNF